MNFPRGEEGEGEIDTCRTISTPKERVAISQKHMTDAQYMGKGVVV